MAWHACGFRSVVFAGPVRAVTPDAHPRRGAAFGAIGRAAHRSSRFNRVHGSRSRLAVARVRPVLTLIPMRSRSEWCRRWCASRGPSPAPRGTRLASSRGPRLERRRRGFRITGKAHRQTKTTHRRPRLKSPFTKHYGNVKKRKTRLLTLLSRLGLRMDTAHSTAHRGRLGSRGSTHRATSWFHAMRVALGACAMRAAGSTMPRGVVGSPPGVCPPPRRTRPAAPHASTHYSGSSAF